ncbi:GntR family transcriptional regulator, carbon starvation induced regulator [Ketogulonicigenium robustum]|uniref:GntR family transcriptional regulator, carbon starvation induced regulator n=1 Tax=Ketogulonicigenium robustum TaxID=92947 RepID=A0A1W6NX89_9RHOB|nr:FCD domain-containing protein [Ketogulonicigenium robustum]ARO13844.1 GntR family transcriptional regulator, carbon starvation induced regulator [Ketogulonicigenium robustum]
MQDCPVQDPQPIAATAGEAAYQRIRNDIIFGRLAPGLRLKLDQARAHYDISVSTLREILYRLCAEGLMRAEGQKGFSVPPVSQENFRELAAMRAFLETSALQQSFALGDVEWEADVVAAHHRLSRLEGRIQAGQADETEQWKRYDWGFHHALIAACGSQVLLDTHALIFDQYLRYQMIAVIFRGESAADEHRALMECALGRDADRAVAILHGHINACVAHTIRNGLLPAATLQ